jgi:cystathionine beta-lyase/cystathionine gamma-synthase
MKTKIGKSVKSNVRRSVWGSEDNSVSNPVYYSVWRLVCDSVYTSLVKKINGV